MNRQASGCHVDGLVRFARGEEVEEARRVREARLLGHVVVPPAAEPQRVARVWGEAVQRAAVAARHHPVAGAV